VNVERQVNDEDSKLPINYVNTQSDLNTHKNNMINTITRMIVRYKSALCNKTWLKLNDDVLIRRQQRRQW